MSKEFPSKSQRKSLTVDQNFLALPKIDDAKLLSVHYEPLNSYYRLRRSCGQSNIFTPVCQSFCSQEGCLLLVPGGLPGQTPPLGRHPPWADTPRLTTPRQTPWATPPHGADTPPPDTVNERPVRILLECILVSLKNATTL